MIIDFDSYLKNDDIRAFADFIRTSVQKKPNDWEWLILLECACTEHSQRNLKPGNTSDRIFSALVNDAAADTTTGASLFQKSVCHAIIAHDGRSEEFSEQEIQQIFKTVTYFGELWFDKSVDTKKIYLHARIPAISQIYHFCHFDRWSVYDQHISSMLDGFAQDFAKANPDAAARLGDRIRFPVPDETGSGDQDFLRNGDLGAIKFVQASLLIHVLADNLNEHRVMRGSNRDWWPEGKWGFSQVARALSWLGESRKPRAEKQRDDLPPPRGGRLTVLE